MKLQSIVLSILFIVPVVAAHYYNLDLGSLTVVSALASVLLWVALIQMIVGNRRSKALRTSLRMVLFTLLAIYYYSQFLSYYLQGSYFNSQFFFHMNPATITETWQVYYPLFFIFVGLLVAIWITVWAYRDQAPERGGATPVILLALLFAVVFDPGLRGASVYATESLLHQQDENLNSIEWDALGLNRTALDGHIGAVRPGKNLVMVFLEGFDQLYTDAAVFPGLTPNLNMLDTEGWRLDNMRQVRGAGWTMGGLVASLCGTPLLHKMGIGGNNIMFTEFLNRAKCLPDILRAAGYQQTYLGGASLEFAGKGNFLTQHSFDHVLGREKLKQRLDDPRHMGDWGLFDDSLFDIAIEEYERLSRDGSPFNLTMLTVDTHHPKGEASKSCPEYGRIDNSILHAVHCTDLLVGRFVERLKKQPAYPDTVVVLVADHLAMRNDAFSLFPRDYRRRLYFNVLNAGQKGSLGLKTVPMDVAPSVLTLMGVEHEVGFLAGMDVTAMSQGPRDLMIQNVRRNNTIGFLNSNYLTANLTDKQTSFRFGSGDLKVQNNAGTDATSADELPFTASKVDHLVSMPKFTNGKGNAIHLVIDISVPIASKVTVYFATPEHRKYSDKKKRSQATKVGRNVLTFPLPADADFGAVKIDPGHSAGEYTVHSIEVQL